VRTVETVEIVTCVSCIESEQDGTNVLTYTPLKVAKCRKGRMQ
jgi:hypothetical protein